MYSDFPHISENGPHGSFRSHGFGVYVRDAEGRRWQQRAMPASSAPTMGQLEREARAFVREGTPLDPAHWVVRLGDNLNRAAAGDLLILDGREEKNPAADRVCPPGVYRVAYTQGTAPGDVAYFGYPADSF